MRSFYKDLYAKEEIDSEAQDRLFNKLKHKLTDSQKKTCEGKITKEELTDALKMMHNNKSPGEDGIPVEFYKTFWNIIGDDFTEVVNSCFDMENLTESQRMGLISCLFKKGDRLNLQNWRPISLLNADYKLISKVMANRLCKVLQFVISDDQTCSVPGRTILFNCHILRDIVELCEMENHPVALLSIDQMKAFDRVSWDFLFKTLEKLNFGTMFIKCVKTMYNNIKSCVKVNGHISEPFTLERGVRQGCPLSPLLYILVAEVLSNSLKLDKNIQGVTVDSTEFKVTQYADDTTLILKGNASLNNLRAKFLSIQFNS